MSEAEYGVLFQLDGAKYHRRVTNPSPTKSTNRPEMIEWLENNHPDKITEENKKKGKSGLTKAKLFEIIEPLKPKKEFAMYDIARKYGHDVRQICVSRHSKHVIFISISTAENADDIPSISWAVTDTDGMPSWCCDLFMRSAQIIFTPSYNPRSAPIEIIWANIKNPISAQATNSFAHLKEQVYEQSAKITESTWLGAYRTSRAWEDEMYVQDKAYIREENENDDLTILPCDEAAIDVAESDDEEEEGAGDDAAGDQ